MLLPLLTLLASLATAPSLPRHPLFVPSTDIRFSTAGSHLLPEEGVAVPIQVVALDTLEIEVRAVPAERLVRVRGYDEEPGSFDSFRVVHTERRVRPADSLRTWTAELDLTSISRTHAGAFLAVRAWAKPGSERPLMPSGMCDTIEAWKVFQVGSLGVLGTRLSDSVHELAVFDLRTGGPRAGVRVLGFGQDGKIRRRARTDAGGWVRLEDESLAFVVAGSQGEMGWVNLASVGTALDGWEDESVARSVELRNDQGGATLPGGIRLFPYLMRGVHRPGDSVVVGCLVRGPGKVAPAGRKLTWSLRDAAGDEVATRAQVVGREGHQQWRFRLPSNARTGRWEVDVAVGDAKERARLSVEFDPPRRFRIELDTARMEGGVATHRVVAHWQTGRAAAGQPVHWALRWTGTQEIPGLDQRNGWERGRHPKWWTDSVRKTEVDGVVKLDTVKNRVVDGLVEGELDAAGQHRMRIPPPPELRGFTTARLEMRASVFQGGRPVGTRRDYLDFHPRRRPELHMRPKGRGLEILVAAKGGLEPAVADSKLHLQLLLDSSRVLLDSLVPSEDTVRLPLALLRKAVADTSRPRWFQLRLSLPTDTAIQSVLNFRTGLIEVEPARGKHPARRAFGLPGSFTRWEHSVDSHVEPEERVDSALQHHDSLLRDAARRELEPLVAGDTARLVWESAEPGMALVQVLQGDRIVFQEWMPTRRGTNLWARPADPGWDPAVTVVVHDLAPRHPDAPAELVRQAGRLFEVHAPDRSLDLEVEALAPFRPFHANPVRIRNLSGRAGSVVVSAVDRGILDLDNHPLPDPVPEMTRIERTEASWWAALGRWDACLLCREAVGCDLSDERAASQSWEGGGGGIGDGRGGLALGAGGSGRGMSTRARVSFRDKDDPNPVSWVSSVLPLPVEGLTVDVPLAGYTGTLRLAAVGEAGRGAGSAQAWVPVRSPLEMVWAVPLRVAPGDTFVASLTVMGGQTGPGRVRLFLEGPLGLLGDSVRQVRFDSHKVARLEFPVVALPFAGVGRLDADMEQGEHRMSVAALVPQRDERRFAQRTSSGAGRKGELHIPLGSKFLPGSETSRLEVAIDAMPGIDRRVQELVKYPHGCLEQTISAAWPQLHLAELVPGMDEETHQQARFHVEEAIAKLATFQVPGGGLSLWAGGGEPYRWGTIWTTTFLREAKALGYSLPYGFLEGLQETMAAWGPASRDSLEESFRLGLLPPLLREGRDSLAWAEVTARDTLPLSAHSRRKLSDAERWTLALAWHRRGHVERAKREVDSAGIAVEERRSLGGNLSSPVRDRALILLAMTEMGLDRGRDTLLAETWKAVSGSGWLTTSELSAALRALAAADPGARVKRPDSTLEVWWLDSAGAKRRVPLRGRNGTAVLTKGLDTVTLRWNDPRRVVRAEVTRSGLLAEPAAERDSGLRATLACGLPGREGPLPQALPSRTEFVCKVAVRNLLGHAVPNLAATFWLPAGWEVRNDRLEAARAGRRLASGDHRDLRDDRYVEYFDLPAGAEREVTVPMQAVQPGTYRGLEVRVEALYQEAIRARLTLPAAKVAPR